MTAQPPRTREHTVVESIQRRSLRLGNSVSAHINGAETGSILRCRAGRIVCESGNTSW